MKFIITPVIHASVEIQGTKELREISLGLLIYVGIGNVDLERVSNTDFLEKIVQKIISAKLFHSEHTDKIDTSIQNNTWSILFISNFTLYWNCDKWTKIDFWDGARFTEAKPIYEKMVHLFQEKWIRIKTGEFGETMLIKSENLGPLNYVFEF